MSTIPQSGAEQRVCIRGVSWELYQHMLKEVGDGHVRLTYDEGMLEIMSPSGLHEHVKTILARLIEAYADLKGVDVEGFGSTTFDQERLRKGLEPDECYFIANAPAIMGRRNFDWEIDPPPDLAIEVDISRPEVARQPIYATLGVPEIWRYDGRVISILHRVQSASGPDYVQQERSLAFPELSRSQVQAWLEIGLQKNQSAAVRALRADMGGKQ